MILHRVWSKGEIRDYTASSDYDFCCDCLVMRIDGVIGQSRMKLAIAKKVEVSESEELDKFIESYKYLFLYSAAKAQYLL